MKIGNSRKIAIIPYRLVGKAKIPKCFGSHHRGFFNALLQPAAAIKTKTHLIFLHENHHHLISHQHSAPIPHPTPTDVHRTMQYLHKN
jgi:hypothetical protein